MIDASDSKEFGLETSRNVLCAELAKQNFIALIGERDETDSAKKQQASIRTQETRAVLQKATTDIKDPSVTKSLLQRAQQMHTVVEQKTAHGHKISQAEAEYNKNFFKAVTEVIQTPEKVPVFNKSNTLGLTIDQTYPNFFLTKDQTRVPINSVLQQVVSAVRQGKDQFPVMFEQHGGQMRRQVSFGPEQFVELALMMEKTPPSREFLVSGGDEIVYRATDIKLEAKSSDGIRTVVEDVVIGGIPKSDHAKLGTLLNEKGGLIELAAGQDAVGVAFDENTHAILFTDSDGVSSEDGSEQTARIFVSKMLNSLKRVFPGAPKDTNERDILANNLRNTILSAHQEIKKGAEDVPSATTINALIYSSEGNIFIQTANTGDSDTLVCIRDKTTGKWRTIDLAIDDDLRNLMLMSEGKITKKSPPEEIINAQKEHHDKFIEKETAEAIEKAKDDEELQKTLETKLAGLEEEYIRANGLGYRLLRSIGQKKHVNNIVRRFNLNQSIDWSEASEAVIITASDNAAEKMRDELENCLDAGTTNAERAIQITRTMRDRNEDDGSFVMASISVSL